METEVVNSSVNYLPILFQIIVAAGFGITTIIATHLIGPKVRTENKLTSFESGIEVIGNARQPFSIKYFMVAILFVIFDVEVIFMYPWAVNFREFGLEGFLPMMLFLGVILTGFFYEIKTGILK